MVLFLYLQRIYNKVRKRCLRKKEKREEMLTSSSNPTQLFGVDVFQLKKVSAGKRLIILYHGYPASGKSRHIKELILNFRKFFSLKVILIDPDDRHQITKGEVPAEVGRKAMRIALLRFIVELLRPSLNPIVVADAGDNQGMRDSMIYIVLALCELWNRLAPKLGLRKYQTHIHLVKIDCEWWWVAFCRNAVRDRQVDPILFGDAVNGVERTFEAVKELCDTWEVVDSGLSDKNAQLLRWLYQGEKCDYNLLPQNSVFGSLQCSNTVMSTGDHFCLFHRAQVTRSQLKY
jgi:hypothetical protein